MFIVPPANTRSAPGMTVPAAVLMTALAVGLTAAGGDEVPPQVAAITIQSDGMHCVVRQTKLLCADVVTHLREVLRLSPGARVRLRAARAAPFESVKKVMDLLDGSEYPLPVAYFLPPESSRNQE